MIEFLKSDNFMKLVWTIVAVGVIAVGFVNKQEVIDLYKYTLKVCS